MPGQWQFTFSARDLFRGCPEDMYKSFDIRRKRYKKYENISRKDECARIFADTFFEILLDIIENNVTFVPDLPWGDYSEISMDCIEGELFKEMYRKGSFKGVDFVLSEGMVFHLAYKRKYKNGNMKSKPIYLNKVLQDILNKKINEGKKYF